MPRTLTPQRQREVEALARSLLGESSRIGPYELADRAKIDFFLARGVLRLLANRGQATEFPSGSFGPGKHTIQPNMASLPPDVRR